MKSLAKKVVIYSMVAILQCGIGAATLEASPRQDNQQNHARDNRDRNEQSRYENERHEREMQRRHHESEREWHERQRFENERHDHFVRDIEAAAIIYLLLNH